MILQLLEISVFRLFLSLCCGLVLGIERELRRQVIGMRTLILISVSSCLLGMLSTYMAGSNDFASLVKHDVAVAVNTIAGYARVSGDPSRIAAGVVSGIGFLGAGTIIVQGLNIRGVTTAAIIWTASATGLAIGGGLYLPAIASVAVALLSLISLDRIEGKYFPASKLKSLHLVFENDNVDLEKIQEILLNNGLIVSDINMSWTFKPYKFTLRFFVKSPMNMDYNAIFNELDKIYKLNKFAITD